MFTHAGPTTADVSTTQKDVRAYAWVIFALTVGLLLSDYMSRQVLNAVRAGESTTDIADALGLSAVTVRRHVSSVVRKPAAQNLAHLRERLAEIETAA